MVSDSNQNYDVVIVGGGPSGTTVASLVRKYNPKMRVLIIEKEKFPRDHVGESQLPGISLILNEMGVWDKVEAANFPIKIGASYTWGAKKDQWDFDFFPVEKWQDEPRPATYSGQRMSTAFQVDRAVYDNILLRHAEEMGAEVREEVKVDKVNVEGQRITSLELSDGTTVTGTHYVDGSGVHAILRRALNVESWSPKELRNIAVWDYWQNAEWALEIGTGATRVQVRSLPYGWLWFIPLGPTRTSIGLICPSDYYKKTGKSPEELYLESIQAQEHVSKLTENAEREGPVQSCRDWSHISQQLAGDNWFLVGESAGFADPILAAGMHLAHQSARHVAYTILELERGEHEADWLKERYDDRLKNCINTHIRFAQFWYSANGCFTDLQEHCSEIAKEAGLKLSPGQAWRWLSQGGFVADNPNKPLFGLWDVESARGTIEKCLGDGECGPVKYTIDDYNDFTLNLKNAKRDRIEDLGQGRIKAIDCWRRGDHVFPLTGYYKELFDSLEKSSDITQIIESWKQSAVKLQVPKDFVGNFFYNMVQSLEAMACDGWVFMKKVPGRGTLQRPRPEHMMRESADNIAAIEQHNKDVSFKLNI